MVRGRILFVFSAVLLVAGIACFISKCSGSGIAPGDALLYVGASLLLLATCSALMAWTVVRRGCRELEESLNHLAAEGKLRRIDASESPLIPLAHAVNELVDFAESSVADAAIKFKELEIQLKVATAQRNHAEAILYSINDAVIVTDPFDDLVLANESAARTLGFDLAKATRKPIDRVISDPALLSLVRDMRQSESVTNRRTTEYQVKTANGNRTYKVTLSCIAGANKQPAGVVTVLHDVTKEKEVSEMKNDFVSNVSHELRTPLASIKAYVEMLIDGEADNEKTQREFYDVIQSEANRLGRLIDNILNVSRIESGLVKVNKLPQSLTVILKEAIEVISPQAKAKGIQIEEQMTPVFYQTLADKDMLYQAVLNLLSNAVKYTPNNGRITVQNVVDETKRKVITRITDTGVGIPAKDLPYVFDKFYRVEANSRMAKGTGLGLPLVKQIIETVHHGSILLDSQVGKGSTFSFELDLT